MKAALSILLVGIIGILLIGFTHTVPKRYVGTITHVDSWDGAATLKTTTIAGKDTTLRVSARRSESFVVGQIITVWTGGDILTGIATTQPQH